MDERLRLTAELKDNMSAQLKMINKLLGETKRTPGMEQAQKWFQGFNDTARDFVKSGGGIAGVMDSIGIGGLTAATSLGLLVKQFKDLGDHAFAMKKLGQETGLTIDQIRRWEFVGQIFRVPVEQMEASLKTLGDKMVDFRRRRGELFGNLNQMDPGEAAKLLGMKDADKQFHEILRWLSTIKDAANRNRWAKEFFGSDTLDALLTNGLPALEKALAKAKLKVVPLSPEMEKQADELAASIVDLNTAWENFELKIGPGFLKALTAIVKASGKAVETLTNPPKSSAFDELPEVKKRKEQYGNFTNPPKTSPFDELPEVKRGKERYKRFWDWLSKPPDQPSGSLHKSAYFGDGNGLRQNAAFMSGDRPTLGAALGLETTIAAGTEEGVLAAFRRLMAQQSAEQAANGGLIKASYESGGAGGAGGGGRRFGGGSGSGGGDSGPISGTKGALDQGAVAAYIRESALKRGIDPKIALAVARSEGLRKYVGDSGTSFGPFQLHYGGSGIPGVNSRGLGDAFTKATGLDARDPRTVRQQIDFALNMARQGGWGPWHGAAHIGVFGRRGIGPLPAGGGTGISKDMSPMGAPGSDVGMHLRTLNAECVSLAKAAVGATGSVTEWRKGVGALAGTLKPGTPIATFLDRQGHETDRYAGGGTGTRGAHLDHAGVFQGYIRDANGKIIGMRMAEQYKGSHGIHSRAYQFGSGWGEGNASNYHAILGRDGDPLGGQRNPMSHHPSLVAEDRRVNGGAGQHVQGGIEAHVHIHDGQVRGARASSSGVVAPPKVHLRRGPTMTEASMYST